MKFGSVCSGIEAASVAWLPLGFKSAFLAEIEPFCSALLKERLQGFPDDYTLITYGNKPAADGPRYRALGNSMAVPVMRWLGERIAMVAAL